MTEEINTKNEHPYRFQNGGVGKDRGKTGERPGNGKIMKVINLVGKDRGKTNV